MVNSWMDAPSRRVGAVHRVYRHHPIDTPIEACKIYGETVDGAVLTSSPINNKIAHIVHQHLVLDGLLSPKEHAFIAIFHFNELIKHIAAEKAQMIKDTIQVLEKKLNELEVYSVAGFLLLLLGIAMVFIPSHFPLGFFSGLLAFFLVIPVSLALIFVSVSEYFSYSDSYRKIKEQEKFGQIECVECEAKTAVLVHKQNSTFVVCRRCGFAWKSYDYVKSRLSRCDSEDKSFDEEKEIGLQLLDKLLRYFPHETIINALQELRTAEETALKDYHRLKVKIINDKHNIIKHHLKRLRLWSYLIRELQSSPKVD